MLRSVYRVDCGGSFARGGKKPNCEMECYPIFSIDGRRLGSCFNPGNYRPDDMGGRFYLTAGIGSKSFPGGNHEAAGYRESSRQDRGQNIVVYNETMKFIVGLGNPGSEYQNTRHNAGIMFVDKMAAQLNSDYSWRRKKDIIVYEAPDIVLVKTAGVFMNESGRMVNEMKLMESDLDKTYVVHDDLDIKLGEYKIQFGTGPKVHHGLQSVEAALRSKNFWRVRIGVDNRGGKRVDGDEYVLQKFSYEEKKLLDEVVDKAIKAII